jgi:mono/diheme cytochrome c family protein
MKTTLKVVAIVLGIICVFVVYVQLTYEQKFDTRPITFKSSSDSAIVARGKYLATSVAHCYTCHMPDTLLNSGAKAPMIGGHEFKLPFGTIYTPNLTPDVETGIGGYTDEQLYNALKNNVSHSGRALVGFMSYNHMGDEDVMAIISYLRTTGPVKNKVAENNYNIAGKILMRFLVKPVEGRDSSVRVDTTIAYGKYLAHHVANCNGCHTRRDALGQFVGAPFAGGGQWNDEDATYTSPNLTPDDSTGRIAKWSDATFMQRFRAGKILPNSPMPWSSYQNMSDRDLVAIHKYLKSLVPAKNKIEATYVMNVER